MTWSDLHIRKMRIACDERKRETKGQCETEDCYSIGWCEHCYKAARKEHKSMNQHEKIRAYMERNGSITPMDAFIDLGITKLSTRIGEMERNGEKITHEREKGKNRFGEKVFYMRYRLEK